MSTISIIPISDSSRVLAERILASYPEAKILPFGSFSKEVFHESSSLVFIGAMGICVRSIAPFAEDKHTDPAVVSCLIRTYRWSERSFQRVSEPIRSRSDYYDTKRQRKPMGARYIREEIRLDLDRQR